MADELNIDWTAAANAENGSMVAVGRDTEYTVTFYMGKVPNFEGTDYHEAPHMRLQAPGNQRTVYDQPVRLDSHPDRPSDPERFPVQWGAFRRGENVSGLGTPLDAWEGVTTGDVRRLDILGIHTVEQLALVADGHLDGLGFGGRLIREKARQFVSGLAIRDPEKERMKEQIDKLTDIVASLLARLDEPAADEPAADEPADEAVAPAGRRRQQPKESEHA